VSSAPSSGTNNPWETDAAEAAFGPHLRKLLANVPPLPTPGNRGDDRAGDEANNNATEQDGNTNDDNEGVFIAKLRAADRRCATARQRQLRKKVAAIQAEVASILSPGALAELETMLGQIAARMGPIADRAALENMTADYARKKGAVCLCLEVENQHKLKALFDFVANLRALEEKAEASKRSNINSNSGGAPGPGKSAASGADDGSDPNDVVGPAAIALHACDRIVRTDATLHVQYELLLQFHKEFKDHIFKAV